MRTNRPRVRGLSHASPHAVWWLNLFCFLAHGVFTGLSLYPGLGDDTGKFDITIWRTKLVWQPGYQYQVSLVDNGMPLRIDYLCAGFFGLSALFHFWACIVGLFESFWFVYWRQLDGTCNLSPAHITHVITPT